MKPIFIIVGAKLPLMIIPDSRAHLDGHPVLTYTYSIFQDNQQGNENQVAEKESKLHLENKTDPDYMGVITFEMPDKLFVYTADGQSELSSDEVQETIELITNHRDKPALWTI